MKSKLMQIAAIVGVVALLIFFIVRAKPDVSAVDARALVRDGATLVDVRSEGEFAAGHVDGAINIPVDGIRDRLAEVPRNKPVVLYCRSGMRSGRAAGILRDEGFVRVHNMGPMPSW